MKRYAKFISLLGVLALVIAACSPSDADETTTTEGEAAATTTEAPDAATTTEAPDDATTTTEGEMSTLSRSVR